MIFEGQGKNNMLQLQTDKNKIHINKIMPHYENIRNGSMRNFVTLTAPVVFRGDSDPNIGVYGIEA